MYKALLIFFLLALAVLGWGYWHTSTNATIRVTIYDSALKSHNTAWELVNEASVILRDGNFKRLAKGTHNAPMGMITFEHPDLGDCYRETQGHEEGWVNCFDAMAKWVPTWFDQVRYAEITVGSCNISKIPVAVTKSKEGWWYWWVPHPHFGGTPYSFYAISLVIDSNVCKFVKDLNAR